MTGEKFVDVDGVRTRYYERGAGPVVVLFHGGHFGSHDAADSADDWSLNFDGLAHWFHVYAIDKIGQGFTDNPKRDEEYTMAAVVQHAYRFLKALGLRKVHPVGHSRGAYLVARLALEHPELFDSCILVDTNTLAPGIRSRCGSIGRSSTALTHKVGIRPTQSGGHRTTIGFIP